MSNQNQIHTALKRLFNEEGHRIVFWNDPDQEFRNALRFVVPENVTAVNLEEVAALGLKIRLEREEPDGKFLLYAPHEEPDPSEDWLLDIRLYSESFRADRASILLQELGLLTASLREHLLKYRKFFDAKDRLQKVKNLILPDDTAPDLDRKMIAVIAKADQPELFNLVRTIFHAWTQDATPDPSDSPGKKKPRAQTESIELARGSQELDLDHPPQVWNQIEYFDLDVPFWQMVKSTFGYEEENPSLKNFLLRLLVTDYAHQLKGDVSLAIRGLLLPKNGWSNAVVCLAQWRDSHSKGASYDRLSAEAAAILKLEDSLPSQEIDQLLDVMTFLVVEKRIASCLRERVQTTADTIKVDEVKAIATRRQAGHWATLTIAPSTDAPRQALHAVYQALVAGSEFLDLWNQHKGGFDYPDAASMYQAYETELYRFDQLHRHFCQAADLAEAQGWNIVKPLRADLEAHYVQGYLTSLALAWGKFLEGPAGLLAKWSLDKVSNQHRFYDGKVKPWLDEADNRRAFVIISDAFRFEAAQELATELNGKYRLEATLSSQLGVVPSYTALGMASLLPHKTLSYRGAEVLVDGKPSGARDRDGILQAVGGLACKAEDLMAKKKEEGREFVKDKRVVYIYHNTVDAVGDDGNTEGKTFEAVRRAMDELAALVGYIANNLSGHFILITADHGFLFTETARVETDRSKIKDKPESTVLVKKRYLLGPNLPETEAAWRGKVSVTAGAEGGMEFWIPKGANLFHFVGGARFAHGGAMLQEIVVPVVTVKQVRGKSAQETKIKPVSVMVLGANHRITTAQHRFQLFQVEPVSERIKATTLRVGVYEGEELVSDMQTVKFESGSSHMDERKKWVSLVLKERPYNKKTPYRLVLRDVETGIEQQSVEVIIDRAFTDDF